jgi:aldehyde:ferredoxin oxidoreductase
MTGASSYRGTVLRVDLSTHDIDVDTLDPHVMELFLGGLGVGAWLAATLIDPTIDPRSPDNVVIFSTSPLTGTLAPAASRVYLTSRSPDSGFLCCANAGHAAGVMMKLAGYDVLILTGRAERPVYLKITDDDVALCDATHLWGLDTWETTNRLRRELGRHFWVDCIGPAAEHRVNYAIILCNTRSSYNKTGPGTVMASKHLKAIAAYGTRGVQVADPERFQARTDAITKRIVADPDLTMYRTTGGPLSDRPGYPRNAFVDRIAQRPYACPSCPVACKHVVNRTASDTGYRISHLVALAGHNRLGGPENWDELVRVVERENRDGIEASVIASTLRYLKDSYEHGVLAKEAIGFTPTLGGEALRHLITLTTNRAGIGALTAEGFSTLIARVGAASEQYARHHKGIGREHRLDREVSLLTLGSLTNPRGGKGDFSHIPFGDGNSVNLSADDVRKFYRDLGQPDDASTRLGEGPDGFSIARLTKRVEDYSTAYMALGFCNRSIIMRHVTLNDLRALYEAATGRPITTAQLLEAGERTFNVLKAFNVRMGASKRDDYPSRGATWPPDRPLRIDGKHYGTLNTLLDDYYAERGWTRATGVPTRAKLDALQLHRIAGDLETDRHDRPS